MAATRTSVLRVSSTSMAVRQGLALVVGRQDDPVGQVEGSAAEPSRSSRSQIQPRLRHQDTSMIGGLGGRLHGSRPPQGRRLAASKRADRPGAGWLSGGLNI